MGTSELWVTGAGHVVPGEGGEAQADPLPFLKTRKSRKFMGRQDDLAVIAAGRALAAAGVSGSERLGLYLAVGYIPFEASDIAPVLAASLDPRGDFSPRLFGEEGLHRAHPLLTFRCLPNMPAFHVSTNFDVQGPYTVVYPGPGQLYLALEEAAAALDRGLIDAALLLGVAHQRNFLVEHHFGRIHRPVPPEQLRDAAGCLVLERPDLAARRGAAPLRTLRQAEVSFDPDEARPYREEMRGVEMPAGELGPASLPVAVSLACERGASLEHRLRGRDGIEASSAWG
jgi:3-oxoacyl-(acyl-carrier-protein) synthase